jgi:outer membrane protein OmpA-like peptidoglycan-associated protein
VKESDTEIRIELAADVLFDFDRANLRAEAREALGRVAGIIREHPRSKVRVEGHTDAKGAEGYNQKLSERRARAVRNWLAKDGGLSRTGFIVKGLGESRPVAPNAGPDGSDDPEGRQKNRRVEIIVAKK